MMRTDRMVRCILEGCIVGLSSIRICRSGITGSPISLPMSDGIFDRQSLSSWGLRGKYRGKVSKYTSWNINVWEVPMTAFGYCKSCIYKGVWALVNSNCGNVQLEIFSTWMYKITLLQGDAKVYIKQNIFLKKCPQVKYIIQYNAVFSLDLFYFISNNNNFCVFTTTVYKTCEMSFKKTGSKFRDTCLLCNNEAESRWVWRWFKNPILYLPVVKTYISIILTYKYHCINITAILL